jgi:LysM repeat protein
MLSDRLLNRITLIIILILVVVGVSACYKDAGEDVEPTSNRVDLDDIAPTMTAPPTAMATPTPIPQPQTEVTRTLVPTTTPVGSGPNILPTAEPTDSTLVEQPGGVPTNTPPFAPSFTPLPTEPGIATPGMSDIQASPTLRPTLDSTFQPTPTALPVEQNPCIHVVKPNDTLYSIAQENDLLLNDLVVANPDLLGGSATRRCKSAGNLRSGLLPRPNTHRHADPLASPPTAPSQEGFPKTHVVQSGETIYAIGRLYGVSAEAIIAANNLANPNLIQPGTTLVIPPPQ